MARVNFPEKDFAPGDGEEKGRALGRRLASRLPSAPSSHDCATRKRHVSATTTEVDIFEHAICPAETRYSHPQRWVGGKIEHRK